MHAACVRVTCTLAVHVERVGARARASAPAAQQQRLARVVRGLGSIGHSYGNVSNYRTELLAEDPVGQPVSVHDVEEEREAFLDPTLSFTERKSVREGEDGITALRQYPRLVRCR